MSRGIAGGRGRALFLGLMACLLLTVAPQQADAAFGLEKVDLFPSRSDGSMENLAGSHPYALSTTIELNTFINGDGDEQPEQAMKDLEVELPPGFVGVPEATPRCSGADFATIDKTVSPPLPNCSDDSAIGYAELEASFDPAPPGEVQRGASAVYNLDPAPGAAAKFGFVVEAVPVTMEVKLSEDAPYRVIAVIRNAPQPLLFYAATLTLWGVPFDSSHDSLRGSCLAGIIAPDGTLESKGDCPVDPSLPREAFLTLPRACAGPLTTIFSADPWEAPGAWVTETSETHTGDVPPVPAGFEGCDELEFDPTIGIDTSDQRAESPVGLDFSVDVEDEGILSPTKRAKSDVKRLVTRLPKGVTLNPSAAEGLAGCTTTQYEAERLTSVPGENCPEASKVGTVRVESPLVDEQLNGSLYVAQPDDPSTATPGAENPFDSFLAVFMIMRNKNLGVIIKQAGEVEADPVTGQLTATFDDIPQLPFSHLEARFREGPRAPLVNPAQCGIYVAEAIETPWANPGEPITTTAQFEVSSGVGGGACLGDRAPLQPGFAAGTLSNKAKTFSPLNLRITRNDGEAEITGFSATLPPGLTGKIAGVPRCSDAAIAAARAKSGMEEKANPSCPSASSIGEVTAGAGVGSELTYVKGTVYLAGPFEGDPFSVVVVTPGVTGPFDVGNIVVREGLTLDQNTAEIIVDGAHADPVPTILKGIPLRLRDLRISTDRPDFILNPTSCEPSSIRAGATGVGPLPLTSTSTATMLARFQAAGCGDLPFKPKLSFSLKGGTRRTKHPAFRSELRARAGDANIGRVAVVLPKSQFIDQSHISNPCTRVQFDADACPKKSILGRARAFPRCSTNRLKDRSTSARTAATANFPT